ncbi:hypothetical protein PIIN_03292 [Serendipita indica DSM 11827]|uniref:Uncharacterized protein n=1 Tax=Serendipita indica (strain DSM 11827) TaxID=1109443 RepID=G4TDM0_SERID|nr:hypothetical protein PIIN_03292 [Serendipita indica DSM 11827]
MWCTRWFLPLIILPVPTTRPYFLVLYLISALFHARPCAYCILILVASFLSSCYWSAIPPSSFSPESLSALNATELKAIWDMNSIELLSRCWCDFQRTPFFGHFNETKWEIDSLKAATEAANLTSYMEPDPAQPTKETRWTRWIDSIWWQPDPIIPKQPVDNRMDSASANAVNSPDPAHQVDTTPSPIHSRPLSRLRRKYDLRPYGIDLILDFGWQRF